MARLSRLSVGSPVALELLYPGSHWRIDAPLNLYSHWSGSGLATQAWAGRALQVLDDAAPTGGRVRVRLLEDEVRNELTSTIHQLAYQIRVGGRDGCAAPMAQPRAATGSRSPLASIRLPAGKATATTAHRQPEWPRLVPRCPS